MKFKNDRQRKAVMSQYNNGYSRSVSRSSGNDDSFTREMRASKKRREEEFGGVSQKTQERSIRRNSTIQELKEINNYLEFYTSQDGTIKKVGLKRGISFKQFKSQNPEYKRKDLIKLFDETEDFKDININEVNN